jgi:hypothetical protein
MLKPHLRRRERESRLRRLSSHDPTHFQGSRITPRDPGLCCVDADHVHTCSPVIPLCSQEAEWFSASDFGAPLIAPAGTEGRAHRGDTLELGVFPEFGASFLLAEFWRPRRNTSKDAPRKLSAPRRSWATATVPGLVDEKVTSWPARFQRPANAVTRMHAAEIGTVMHRPRPKPLMPASSGWKGSQAQGLPLQFRPLAALDGRPEALRNSPLQASSPLRLDTDTPSVGSHSRTALRSGTDLEATVTVVAPKLRTSIKNGSPGA